MSDDRPAHERQLLIEWQHLSYGIRRGRLDGGWLYVKETQLGGGAALCYVPDPQPPDEFMAVQEYDVSLSDAQLEGLIEAVRDNRRGLRDELRHYIGPDAPYHDILTCRICTPKKPGEASV